MACLLHWGLEIIHFHNGNPDESVAPDPKQAIPTFSNIENYKDHLSTAHRCRINELCKEKSCLLAKNHFYWEHGDIRCNICSLSFKKRHNHEEHLHCEHADLNAMSKKQVYELYLKYNT